MRAHRWRRQIESGPRKSITDLAEQEGVTDAYVCRLLPLTCLAPGPGCCRAQSRTSSERLRGSATEANALGNLAGLSCWVWLVDISIERNLPEIARSLTVRALNDPQRRFARSVVRARERLRFVADDQGP